MSVIRWEVALSFSNKKSYSGVAAVQIVSQGIQMKDDSLIRDIQILKCWIKTSIWEETTQVSLTQGVTGKVRCHLGIKYQIND